MIGVSGDIGHDDVSDEPQKRSTRFFSRTGGCTYEHLKVLLDERNISVVVRSVLLD